MQKTFLWLEMFLDIFDIRLSIVVNEKQKLRLFTIRIRTQVTSAKKESFTHFDVLRSLWLSWNVSSRWWSHWQATDEFETILGT